MFITRAAIMYSNGEVLVGWDYARISTFGRKIGFSGERINGFLNSSEEFVLPEEAAVIAARAGQIDKHINELSPDDLWPSLLIE